MYIVWDTYSVILLSGGSWHKNHQIYNKNQDDGVSAPLNLYVQFSQNNISGINCK